ncbi:methyltransferase domain-containing protein [Colwellia sp. MB02u-18]|uniref:class I SAM-dependent methyltransferase n=1 Tax=unclassified Colwellia TaxID=196834 RepID=UPI0015F390AB|nr:MULTISPECIES: class I SAM-dependent methyltransferase [unclassified Colwellia]MBA6222629.1 methyltransferase domain-containing protein [Colwellia sp. MB3u-45]MBA6265968.1 methyltransferase domain-containing protein [Colwellia sp. MB3u-43]MBA6319623.1 methyltransferase domain-containing protein [Colwellia sp. MB02u-19]MBA6324241.1 methyltransferase domain-containing protein [Colwellia sp. MB02u-18]MBA6332790.1 methyltransferase domain-containing protein [Colwellia sp. MB02u-12]
MPPQFYNENANKLAQQYLSKSFDEVHQSWSQLLPSVIKNAHARILDIGAGSGRDAKHIAQLAAQTHGTENKVQIVAVEPANLLAELGARQTTGLNVKWLTDSLPALSVITKQEVSFDLILLSAVWMHIPVNDRARSIRKLANLLKPGGKLVVSLRHGQTIEDRNERKMHAVCADELKQLASDVGLFTKLETQKESDKLGRDHVSWQTLVLQMPDDGTGAFPFIRHVALNDGKSATHKLALLRVLLHIADGHAGAVLRREPSPFGDRVILPVGLVALYWCHQYKDLIDSHNIFQTLNKNPNMGFMKANGWQKLTHRSASDYRIGNLFTGDDAIALHKTLSAAVSNIKTMPCRYITFPNRESNRETNSDNTVFEVASKTVKAKDSIFLDLQTLEQWGEFSLPESTWLAFNRYACWIEPVLVNEWVKTMASYAGNAQYKAPENQYKLAQALNWEEPKRSTIEVRNRFELIQDTLPNNEKIQCVWSAKSLKQQYDIDHSMPFSRWPNNDLWNLLPTDSQVNNQKSDRLPTEQKLKVAKERIQHWWQLAWLDDEPSAFLLRAERSAFLKNEQSQQKRFFAEANIALPGLSSDNSSVDDLSEALVMQRGRLKEMQQLREW